MPTEQLRMREYKTVVDDDSKSPDPLPGINVDAPPTEAAVANTAPTVTPTATELTSTKQTSSTRRRSARFSDDASTVDQSIKCFDDLFCNNTCLIWKHRLKPMGWDYAKGRTTDWSFFPPNLVKKGEVRAGAVMSKGTEGIHYVNSYGNLGILLETYGINHAPASLDDKPNPLPENERKTIEELLDILGIKKDAKVQNGSASAKAVGIAASTGATSNCRNKSTIKRKSDEMANSQARKKTQKDNSNTAQSSPLKVNKASKQSQQKVPTGGIGAHVALAAPGSTVDVAKRAFEQVVAASEKEKNLLQKEISNLKLTVSRLENENDDLKNKCDSSKKESAVKNERIKFLEDENQKQANDFETKRKMVESLNMQFQS